MRIETYKGIEFVRISDMPEEMQARIHSTIDKSKIIKILRDSELLNDCIQATDYQEWASLQKKPAGENSPATEMVNELRLAFK